METTEMDEAEKTRGVRPLGCSTTESQKVESVTNKDQGEWGAKDHKNNQYPFLRTIYIY
jgi:hypothetical protein